MLVFEEMQRAVEAAAPDRLGDVAAAIWKAYGAGGLTDEQVEQLDSSLSARRGAARAAPVKAQPLAAVAAQSVPAVAPPPRGEGAPPSRTHHRTGSRPRTPDSLARRRRMAAAGYMPPARRASRPFGRVRRPWATASRRSWMPAAGALIRRVDPGPQSRGRVQRCRRRRSGGLQERRVMVPVSALTC